MLFASRASRIDLKVTMGTVKLASRAYCFHRIVLYAGTKLSVNGPVTIHLTGRITGTGHIVNPSNLPANLQIDTSFAGTGALVVAGGPHAYMTLVAPGATVTVPSGSFFGRLLARTVNLGGAAAFHADTH